MQTPQAASSQKSRRPSDTSAGDSHTDASSSGSSDLCTRVFQLAPFFVLSSSWTVQKHGSGDTDARDITFVEFTGPFTSERMLQLYKERQLKGSLLVVGLTQDAVDSLASPKSIPSSFFRTLAYLFEVARPSSGHSYTPLTATDLARPNPMPSPSWAKPLWLSTSGRSSSNASESGAGDNHGSQAGSVQGSGDIQAAAATVLRSAPYWCYLYSHDAQRARKTPPKTTEQMLEMYQSGALPDWAPVLGLQEEVAKFNSLPPSLFMPLGSLIALVLSGAPSIKAVGLAELQRYDKFSDSRTPAGSTQGMLHGLKASLGTVVAVAGGTGTAGASPIPPQHQHLSQSGPLATPLRGTPSGGLRSGLSPSPSMPASGMASAAAAAVAAGHTDAHQSAYGSPLPHTAAYGAAGSWGAYGSPYSAAGAMLRHSAGSMRANLLGVPAPYAAAMPGRGVGMIGAGIPGSPAGSGSMRSGSGRVGHSPLMPTAMSSPMNGTPGSIGHMGNGYAGEWTTPTPPAHGGTGSRKKSSKSASGLGSGRLNSMNGTSSGKTPHNSTVAVINGGYASQMPQGSMFPAPICWHTPLFQLFTADMSRGNYEPVWWYLDSSMHAGAIVGPVMAEHMIMAYASGTLTDNHMVCGTTSDVTAAHPPPHELFEPVGVLLQKVHQGGHYVLVTLPEIMQREQQAPAAHPVHVHHPHEVPSLMGCMAADAWGYGMVMHAGMAPPPPPPPPALVHAHSAHFSGVATGSGALVSPASYGSGNHTMTTRQYASHSAPLNGHMSSPAPANRGYEHGQAVGYTSANGGPTTTNGGHHATQKSHLSRNASSHSRSAASAATAAASVANADVADGIVTAVVTAASKLAAMVAANTEVVRSQTLKSSSKGGSVESDTDDIRGPAARDNSHGGASVTPAAVSTNATA